MDPEPESDTWWAQLVSGWSTILSALAHLFRGRGAQSSNTLSPLPTAPSFDPHADLKVLVAVGSTRFDQLVRAVLEPLLYESLDAAADRTEEEDVDDDDNDDDGDDEKDNDDGDDTSARSRAPRRFRHVHLLIQYGRSDLTSILARGAEAQGEEGKLPFALAFPSFFPQDSRQPHRWQEVVKEGKKEDERMEEAANAKTPAQVRTKQDPLLCPQEMMQARVHGHVSGDTQIDLSLFSFAPSLDRCVQDADIVISHCGSGMLLETLRAAPSAVQARGPWQRQIIAVPNRALMDDHQAELAGALACHPHGPLIHVAEAR